MVANAEQVERIAKACGWETYIGMDKVRFWIVGQTALTATGIADLNLLLIDPFGPYQKLLRPKGYLVCITDYMEATSCVFSRVVKTDNWDKVETHGGRDPNLLTAVLSAIAEAVAT